MFLKKYYVCNDACRNDQLELLARLRTFWNFLSTYLIFLVESYDVILGIFQIIYVYLCIEAYRELTNQICWNYLESFRSFENFLEIF